MSNKIYQMVTDQIISQLARISQTYLGDLSNAADEPGPWRHLGGLEMARVRIDRVIPTCIDQNP